MDLLAALNTATGKVIGKLSAQHRAVDFRDFPGDIDRQTEPGLAVHVICDNLCSKALAITCRDPRTVAEQPAHWRGADRGRRRSARQADDR